MIVSGPSSRDEALRRYLERAARDGFACDIALDPALRTSGRVGIPFPVSAPSKPPAAPWRGRFSSDPIAKDETAMPDFNEKLSAYLAEILTPEQLAKVKALAQGEAAPDPVAQDAMMVRGAGKPPQSRADRFPHFDRLR